MRCRPCGWAGGVARAGGAGGVGGIAVQAGRGLRSVIQVLTSQRLRPGHSRGVRKHSGCRDGWQAGPGTLLPRRCGGRGRGWPRPRPAGLFLSHLIKSNQQKLWMRALRGSTAVPKGGLTSPPFACSARATGWRPAVGLSPAAQPGHPLGCAGSAGPQDTTFGSHPKSPVFAASLGPGVKPGDPASRLLRQPSHLAAPTPMPTGGSPGVRRPPAPATHGRSELCGFGQIPDNVCPPLTLKCSPILQQPWEHH